MARVSLAVPVCNGALYIEECLQSVLSQHLQEWELVVVDNCSSDKTVEIAERFTSDPRIRICQNSRFLTLVENYNNAVAQALGRGEYVVVLAVDDLLCPECLLEMVRVADLDSDVVLVGAYLRSDRGLGCTGLDPSREIFSGREICRDRFMRGPSVLASPSNHLIRAERLPREPFDVRFGAQSDTNLFVQLLTMPGAKFGFIHKALTFSRIRDDSATATYAYRYRTAPLEELVILTEQGERFLTPTEYARLCAKYEREYHRFLFRQFLRVWDREVLNYHRKRASYFGIDVTGRDLAIAALTECVGVLRCPRQAMRRALRDLSRLKVCRRMVP